jgi:hypothetical protein
MMDLIRDAGELEALVCGSAKLNFQDLRTVTEARSCTTACSSSVVTTTVRRSLSAC